jgi:hypothetical protein
MMTAGTRKRPAAQFRLPAPGSIAGSAMHKGRHRLSVVWYAVTGARTAARHTLAPADGNRIHILTIDEQRDRDRQRRAGCDGRRGDRGPIAAFAISSSDIATPLVFSASSPPRR